MAAPAQTLLEMTQDILSDIDGEDVNSIDDTVESSQVAQIIVDTFYDLVTLRVIPEHKELIKLEALGDSTKPNYLRIPSDVVRLNNDEFFYNVADVGETLSYGKVHYVEPELFLARIHKVNPDNSTTDTVLDVNAGTTLYIHNDLHPTFFTTFDDVHIVCNAYDSSVDSTLQASKSQAMAVKIPSFTKSNSSTPDLDPDYFPYLKSEARARAFAWSNKEVNEKAEQVTQRNKVMSQIRTKRLGSENRKRRYGRT